MRMGFGRLVVLPLLAFLLVLGLGATVQAKESGWLGVMLQPLTDEIAQAMDIESGTEGVLVSDVVDDSPADEYGIEEGDIIIMIDKDGTPTIEEAIASVKDHAPGDKVDVVVIRDGDKKTIQVELGGRDSEMMDRKIKKYEFVMPDMEHMPDMARLPEMGKRFARGWMKPHGYLGVRVTEITEDLGSYFGVKSREGVLVIEVVGDSPAEYAGLKEGDVILKVDGKDIEDPDGLVKYMAKCEPGEEVEVTYKRQRRTRTVMVELEGAPGQGMYRMQKCEGMGEGHGKQMMKMGCGHADPSRCTKECMEKCKQMDIMGGDGKCHMKLMDDDGDKKRIVIKSMGEGGCHGEGGKVIIKTDDGVKTIDLSDILSDMDIDVDLDDIEMDLDDLGEMQKDIHMYHMDAGDMKEEIEQLQQEINGLKKEIEELKKS